MLPKLNFERARSRAARIGSRTSGLQNRGASASSFVRPLERAFSKMRNRHCGFKRVQFVRYVQDCVRQEHDIGIRHYGLDLEPAFVAVNSTLPR
jgi:hypothetical protein